jgi:LacI family transcriptional regulator
MNKKVSLKDIAQKVGVSAALVSYVLNNKKTGRINKDVAQKIKDVAEQLRYRTNHIARSLKTNKTFTIGLIVSNIGNTFSSTLARIIEDEAYKNDYTVLFGSSDESTEKSVRLMEVLLNHSVDGLIIAPSEEAESQILYLEENDVPFVLIDRYLPHVKTNYVAIDNYKSAYGLVKHLIVNGNKRIGIITFKSSLINLMERKRGYTSAMKESKLTSKKSWIREVGNNNIERDVQVAVDDLLSLPEPIEAIMFASNTLSAFGLKYINSLPITVPDDLAIAAFDQSEASEIFYAPLTHIKQPLEEMGQMATRILLELINKNNKITQVNMEAELVIGKSSIKGIRI